MLLLLLSTTPLSFRPLYQAAPTQPQSQPRRTTWQRSTPPLAVFQSPFPSPELPSFGTSQSMAEGEFMSSAWPVRTMVFIDGSWLYYSLHGRRAHCPVQRAFGNGWEFSHSVAYERLPQLISRYIHKDLLHRHQSQRFVEVVRTVVFSSARADTHQKSARMRMFKAMEEANFEVHMATTTGLQEKCIDISLAVEMMHYASVPGAYDVAVLLSGDKDFIPAMARIRQKGKRVALCSMRNCCSRDLVRPLATLAFECARRGALASCGVPPSSSASLPAPGSVPPSPLRPLRALCARPVHPSRANANRPPRLTPPTPLSVRPAGGPLLTRARL
jgi:hypothetical protein